MLVRRSLITLAIFFTPSLVDAVSLKMRLPGVTRTDVVDGLCRDVTLLFARGTNEEDNLGGVSRPPLTTGISTAK